MFKYIFILFSCIFFVYSNHIDNSSLETNELGTHKKTYGLVYIVPKNDMKKLDNIYFGLLNEKLTLYNVNDALNRKNIPHITIIHLHTDDIFLPQKILKLLPKPPKPFTLTLNGFSLVKASKNSKMPWWFDINVLKDSNYEIIMKYNFEVTKTLSPLRSSPLPRVSGFVYKDSNDEVKSQIRDLGVNGLNRIINGKEERMYRPHVTFIYSMQNLESKLEKELLDLADELNSILTKGIKVKFNNISIVELGVSGNVLREIYRINLENGNVIDISKEMQR